MRFSMKNILILLIAFLGVTIGAFAISVKILSNYDWCIITEKAKAGHRIWHKDWNELDKNYDMRCKIRDLITLVEE
jgi:hypothetical protein